LPKLRRLSTGIPEVDKLIAGGIPEGFLVAITGEPGTGKTVFCMHFIAQGLRECDKCVYVTTEESRESILRQAEQFNLGFREGLEAGKLIIIDALTGAEDRWSLKSLDVEALVDKVIEAKKELGRGRGRLVIDSMSAFWLDKPAMARKYSYFVKKVLARWGFTTLAVSQYAITTSVAWDEPVAIRDASGRVRVLPIGEFVDEFFLKGEEGSIDVSGLGLETLALDLRSLKVVWKPIARVVRRRAVGPLYEVRLEAGRSVKISPDHSIYVLEDLRPTPKAGRDLEPGDFVLAPARLPELTTWNAKDIDLLSELAGHEHLRDLIYVHDVPEWVARHEKLLNLIRERYSVGRDTQRYYWRSRRVFPLEVLLEAGIGLSDLKGCKFSLVAKPKDGVVVGSCPINGRVPVNEKLMRLLGYYTAEGFMKENKVVFTFSSSEEDYVADLVSCLRELFGLDAKVYEQENKLVVDVNSKTLRIAMELVLGLRTGARNKTIPDLVLSAPPSLQRQFLVGLFRGDGHYQPDRVLTYTTASRELASSLSLLLLSLGVFPTIVTSGGRRFDLNIAYGEGRKALSDIARAMGKPVSDLGLPSRFTGIPKAQVVELLRKLNPTACKSGTYTHLGKVRTSRRRVLEKVLKPEKLRRRADLLISLLDGAKSARELAACLSLPHRVCVRELERLASYGLVRRAGSGAPATYELTEDGREEAEGLMRLRSLLPSDLAFLRVRSVRQVPYDKPFVYDLSVKGAENFVAGLGGVICHNSEAFGFGIEHIADGIIRFRRFVRGGVLRRFLLVEKMRQTPHSLTMHEVIIIDGRGVVVRPARITKEDVALPGPVVEKIARASAERELEAP